MPSRSGSPPTFSEPQPPPCDISTSRVWLRTGQVRSDRRRNMFVSLLAPWTQRRPTGARSPARRGAEPRTGGGRAPQREATGAQPLHCAPRSFPDSGSEANSRSSPRGPSLTPPAGDEAAGTGPAPAALGDRSGLPTLSGLSFPGCRMGSVTMELPPGGVKMSSPRPALCRRVQPRLPHTVPSVQPPGRGQVRWGGRGGFTATPTPSPHTGGSVRTRGHHGTGCSGSASLGPCPASARPRPRCWSRGPRVRQDGLALAQGPLLPVAPFSCRLSWLAGPASASPGRAR